MSQILTDREIEMIVKTAAGFAQSKCLVEMANVIQDGQTGLNCEDYLAAVAVACRLAVDASYDDYSYRTPGFRRVAEYLREQIGMCVPMGYGGIDRAVFTAACEQVSRLHYL